MKGTLTSFAYPALSQERVLVRQRTDAAGESP